MTRIHFITDYEGEGTERQLDAPVSCVTVSKYIREAILDSSNNALIILSTAPGKEKSYLTQQRLVVSDREKQVYLAVLKRLDSKIIRIFNQVLTFVQLCFYILFSVKKDDYVLIYHGYGISKLIWYLRNYLKRRFVFFVGEIYTAVGERSKKEIDEEIKYISDADGYIYGNDLMNNILGFEKPYAVCYSSYKYKESPMKTSFNDNKIHVVYAGKIASRIINDAFLAVESAMFLNEKYRVHILGYGSDGDLKLLNEAIERVNKEKGYKAVTYDGCLYGEEYEDFLYKCDVGLCTRSLPEPYSSYCFPSKTLIYMSHNITPICPKIPALLQSKISEAVTFIDDLKPESIAFGIKSVDGKLDSHEIMSELDIYFKQQIEKVFV